MPLLFGKTGEIRCTKNGFFRTKNGKTETKNRIFRPDFTVSENAFLFFWPEMTKTVCGECGKKDRFFLQKSLFAGRNRPFCLAKVPLSHPKSATFASPKRHFSKAKRPLRKLFKTHCKNKAKLLAVRIFFVIFAFGKGRVFRGWLHGRCACGGVPADGVPDNGF